MNNVELTAEEFLSLYQGIMFTTDYDTLCEAIKKVFGVEDVYTHELPYFVEEFRKNFVNNNEILVSLEIIGRFIPAEDHEDKTNEAYEYVQSFIKTYGAETISINKIDITSL